MFCTWDKVSVLLKSMFYKSNQLLFYKIKMYRQAIKDEGIHGIDFIITMTISSLGYQPMMSKSSVLSFNDCLIFVDSGEGMCHPQWLWNGNIIILMKLSSLAALKVVILTTFSAASDDNFIKMTKFSFHWMSTQSSWSTNFIGEWMPF